MSELCPTCGSPVTIEGGPTTHYYVPALGHDKSLVKALIRIKQLEAEVEKLSEVVAELDSER